MTINYNLINALNLRYQALSVEARIKTLYNDFNLTDVMCTSSFGANSAFLLKYMVSLVPEQVIHFIDTGNHFEETIQYRDELIKTLNLNTEVVTASPEIHQFTRENETWKDNPEHCCHLKKVVPIQQIKSSHKVWISGLMDWQSDHRASLSIFEMKRGMLKFYPLLDKSKKDFDSFLEKHKLPSHPLLSKGYSSIGCTHCTKKGLDRLGRWFGTAKTECGLHL